MPRFAKTMIPLICLLVALASPAHPEEPGGGTYSVQIENDRIAKTDRHYTNGLRLSWVSDKSDGGTLWARDLLQTLYPLATVHGGRLGFVLGQNMYTPEDTATRLPMPDNRPYAGWLYGGVSVHAETSRPIAGVGFDRLDTVELDIGVVGPPSFAEQAQIKWHRIIGVARPNGWDNQLDTEPGLVLIFERKWRPLPLALGPIDTDLLPHIGGSLGNIMTLARGGLTLRIGQGLDLDYGPPLIRPSLSGLAAVEIGRDFGWYVFAGGEARAVLRNIFLDGNTFGDGPSVDKRLLVGDFQVGAALIFRGVRLSFTHVFRTPEFKGQRRGDRYGALGLSVRF